MIASRALLRSVAVVRFRIWLATALAFGALVAGLLRAQVNEEKRRDQSEETEARAASTPKPKKSPTPKTKRRHTPTPKPAKKKTGAKKASDKTTKSAKSKSARKEETPKPRKTPTPQVEEGAPRPNPQRRRHGRLPCQRQRLRHSRSLRVPFQRAARLRL